MLLQDFWVSAGGHADGNPLVFTNHQCHKPPMGQDGSHICDTVAKGSLASQRLMIDIADLKPEACQAVIRTAGAPLCVHL
jgi:hypothetical protein